MAHLGGWVVGWFGRGSAFLAAVALIVLPSAGSGLVAARAPRRAVLSPNVTVFATGFNNPRGFVFGPDGQLYVAEAGTGGARSTVGVCQQAPVPAEPYTGGMTACISKIGPHGVRVAVADKLPSDQMAPKSANLVSGIAAVTFMGGTLYALLAWMGCSHGLAGMANAVIRVQANGSSTRIADLSDFLAHHPVA